MGLKNLSIHKNTGLAVKRLGLLSVIAFAALALIGGGFFGTGTASALNDEGRSVAWNNALTFTHCDAVYLGFPATIQQGSTGNCVILLQHMLNAWNTQGTANSVWSRHPTNGFYDYPSLAEDGAFGPATYNQVRGFQDWLRRGGNTITVDGIVGPATWFMLYSCYNISPSGAYMLTCWIYPNQE